MRSAAATNSAAKRPLRIALLSYRGNMRCGGQGVYLWHLARELSRRGHRVEVWTGPPYPDPMPFVDALHPVPGHEYFGKWFISDRRGFLPKGSAWRALHPLSLYELGASWLGFLVEPALFSLRALHGVSERMRTSGRFDLVHDVQSLGYGLLGLRAHGLPVISTIHHPLTVDRNASFRSDRGLREAVGTAKFYPIGMQRAVARRLDAILTSSQTSARRIAHDFGVSPDRLIDVANGVDTQHFRPGSDSRDETRLLCVARAADPNKGVRDLITALAELPDEISLELVDDDGPSNPARVWARDLGCGHRLHIRGALSSETLARAYRKVALAVVPSHHEGFGLPAVEAMASGTPVVAAAGGALPELLSAGGGLVVPVGQPRTLAAAIRHLLAKPAERERLGRIGREVVTARYAWGAIAERTLAAYRAVLSGEIGRRACVERTEPGRPKTMTTSESAGH